LLIIGKRTDEDSAGRNLLPGRRTLCLASVATLLTGLGVAGVAASSAGAASGPVVVMSHLNNPRQLQLVGDGSELLIAEAGRGGPTQVGTGDDATYVGPTGSISAVFVPQNAHGLKPYRLVKGLMSAGSQNGSFAVGSDGVSSRAPRGRIYIQETYAPGDVVGAPFGTTQDGRLLTASPYSNSLHTVYNVSYYEKKNDPDHHGFDSDPYAVLARSNDVLVADAAGNDILSVGTTVRTFHVFPNVTTGGCAKQADPGPQFPGCNFVPTSMATDAAGHVYVGGLSSETPGQAQVVVLSADGRKVLGTYRGFTSVTGVAVDAHGNLYVSQLEAAEAHPASEGVVGVLTKIDAAHHRTNVDVPFPAGVAVDNVGNVFVAAWSVAPEGGFTPPGASDPVPGTSGQVWRLHF
jgi:hypothetical protein